MSAARWWDYGGGSSGSDETGQEPEGGMKKGQRGEMLRNNRALTQKILKIIHQRGTRL